MMTRRIQLTGLLTDLQLEYTTLGDRTSSPVLLLHGSGGTASLGQLPTLLAEHHFVIVPSHPGFDGTDRPSALHTIRHLASVYSAFLDALDLQEVTVVGFSLGGWIAMETTLQNQGRVRRLALVDPIGVATENAPILNPATLPPDEAVRVNYADPAPFLAAAASASEAQRAVQAANAGAASTYTEQGLDDPTLPTRLSAIDVPVQVIFGSQEQIVPVASGRSIVTAVAGAAALTFIDNAGHRPQLERPHELAHLLDVFSGTQGWPA